MHCPVCGSPLNPGDGFCGSCGADVSAVTAQPQPPAPAPAAPQPPSAYPAPTQAAMPPQQPIPTQAAAPTQQPKRRLSVGAIIAIVAGVLLLGAVLVGGVGLLAFRAYTSSQTATTSVIEPETPPPVATATPEPAVEATAPAADGIVTEDEARAVVTQFLDTRIAGDIEGSKAFCTQNMLTGENGGFVGDQYWKPDSYTITRTTPDLMYVHVTTMGAWPSGEEPTIYSVVRDPESGKVLIDGMLDPANSPELWQ